MDKSQHDHLIGKLIVLLLRKEQHTEGEKIHWFIFLDDNKIFLAASEPEKQTITYPLEWKEAAFIGYSLLQMAIRQTGYDIIIEYMRELASRCNEIIEWIDEASALFKRYKGKKK